MAGEGCTVRVVEAGQLGGRDLDRIRATFARNYRDANVAYMEKSLQQLRYVALAEDGNGALAGFALGESRVLDLPRLPGQVVRLAGLCCVDAAYRRHGLFGTLAHAALAEGALPDCERSIMGGRMAHPASFRGMARNPTAVPRQGNRPTAWQQEAGAAIAFAYGTASFDPVTFVCHGSGTPVGWPIIDVDATAEEWGLFAAVDRSKGDSLLGIAWSPDAPPGWDEGP
jgi:hypothetical protein